MRRVERCSSRVPSSFSSSCTARVTAAVDKSSASAALTKLPRCATACEDLE
jgi:hypothetical protein